MEQQRTLPKQRENDPHELDRFKQQINLVEYAVNRHGYQVSDQSRKGDWHKLEKGEETLVVTKKDSHQVYLNTGDDRDAGSVVDFAKARGNLNLGQVRQELRQYLGETGPAQQVASSPTSAPAREKEAPAPLSLDTEREHRARILTEVLGVNKGLTDTSYLKSRGLTEETIHAPAFQGRIFTAQQNDHKNTAFPLYNEQGLTSVEQKNHNYKNLLEGPKDGVWVSHPTGGKEKPLERLVVSESAIDSLSKYQLEHKGQGPNTMYVATTGTPTERQTELIQRIIDKLEPKQIALANDNDAGGRRFNMNYLNDLQPARKAQEVEGHLTYNEANRPVEWHAVQSGKYHSALRVLVRHDDPEQGADQLKQLTTKVATLNDAYGKVAGQGTQDTQPPLTMEVIRSSSKETLVRIEAPNSEVNQLEKIAGQLYQQRELTRSEQERHAPGFIKVEYATTKDYNRDLELVNAGKTPEQIQTQATVDEQQRLQQKQAAEQERQQRQQRDEQERQQQEKEKRDNSPEAVKQRQKDDQQFTDAVMTVAAGAVVAKALEPEDPKKVELNALRDAQVVLLKDGEHLKFNFKEADPNHPLFRAAQQAEHSAPTRFSGWRPDQEGPILQEQDVKERAAREFIQTSTLDKMASGRDNTAGLGGESAAAQQWLNQPAGSAQKPAVEFASEPSEKYALIRVEEPKPKGLEESRAGWMQEQLHESGAGVKATILPESNRQTEVVELRVAYSMKQDITEIHQVFEYAKSQPGVVVQEGAGDRADRVATLANYHAQDQGVSLAQLAEEYKKERAEQLPALIAQPVSGYLIVQEAPINEGRERNTIYAEAVRDTLEQRGATAAILATDKPITYAGVEENKIAFTFKPEQAEAQQLVQTLDKLNATPGVQVHAVENPHGWQHLNQTHALDTQAISIPERAHDLAERRTYIDLAGERAPEAAQQLQQAFTRVGASAEIQPIPAAEGKAVDFMPDPTHKLIVAYRVDQPELPAIHQTISNPSTALTPENKSVEIAKAEDFGVVQHRTEVVREIVGKDERVVDKALTPELDRDAERTVNFKLSGTGYDQRDRLTHIGQELALQGMVVGEVKTVERETVLTATYRTDQPIAQQAAISDTLDRFIRADSRMTVQEQPQAVTERQAVSVEDKRQLNQAIFDKLPNEPGRAPQYQVEPSSPSPIRYVGINLDRATPENIEKMESIAKTLAESGATVSPASVAGHSKDVNNQTVNIVVGYRLDQPELKAIDQQLTALSQDKSLRPSLPNAAELAAERTAELATRTPQIQVEEKKPLTSVETAAPEKSVRAIEPGSEKVAIVNVDEVVATGKMKGKAEAIHDHVERAGANVSEVKSTTGNDGVRHSEMTISYRTDQKQIGEISHALDIIGKAGNGVQLTEAPGDRGERQQAAQKSMNHAKAAEIER